MPSPLIVELDFGMGNIRSLQKAFEYFGQPVNIISKPEAMAKADAILLPGDGAFKTAMAELKARGMQDALRDFVKTQKPVFGICIGFQVLFSSSQEFGLSAGLDFLDGRIEKFNDDKFIVPHMGWSETTWGRNGVLNRNIPEKTFFYYIHSYRLAGVHPHATAFCNYDGEFSSVIEKDNIFATQFHPEKSQKWGLKIIENFINHVRR